MNPPRFAVPAKWGLCFDGNEATYCSALDLAHDAAGNGWLNYVEIGLGYGDTMRAAQVYLKHHRYEFSTIGVDIPSCYHGARTPDCYPFPARTKICLNGSESFFRDAEIYLHFVFIDGCHGAACVKADFLGAERVIAPGGVVVFHDTDIGCQGIHFQDHCKTGIDARKAVIDLGLLDGSRKGWKVLAETTGDKSRGGHGILVIQRDQ